MDNETARMCQMGVGRMGFARVLVEMSATKEIPEWIEVVCANCCIFGHTDQTCGNKNQVDVNAKTKDVNGNNGKSMNDGFEEVRYKKNGVKGDGRRQQFQTHVNGKKVQPKPVEQYAYKPKPTVTGVNYKKTENSNSPKKAWHVQGELLAELKKEIVEEFLRQKKELTDEEKNNWNLDMIAYYKQRKKHLMETGEGSSVIEENDVMVDKSGIAQCMEKDELNGLDAGILGKKN
ncbi:hypothetical protein CTI12_AA507570 [Artemisia annua]|uniref:Zinc knuckle CX2CX4HX4C n=1 Tax=Artemisia annua TaxID=35608 RepID=A0A2U1L898_ARTAN|nr:hypothetical protein CTI12_AA507570 [Artemisia annua]